MMVALMVEMKAVLWVEMMVALLADHWGELHKKKVNMPYLYVRNRIYEQFNNQNINLENKIL
jgi:hypothetical protein